MEVVAVLHRVAVGAALQHQPQTPTLSQHILVCSTLSCLKTMEVVAVLHRVAVGAALQHQPQTPTLSQHILVGSTLSCLKTMEVVAVLHRVAVEVVPPSRPPRKRQRCSGPSSALRCSCPCPPSFLHSGCAGELHQQ